MKTKRMMRLKDDKMRLIVNKHLDMVKKFDDDASDKRHSQLYFYFYPIVEGIDYKKYNDRWARKGDIDVNSVGNIGFCSQVYHNFDNGGRSIVLFHFHMERFMVELRDESVKYYNGCYEITKAEYIERMTAAMAEHYKIVDAFRTEKRTARKLDNENKKEWVKSDGGLKMAIDSKEIVPKSKVMGPCVLVAFANATDKKIAYWYNILTTIKMLNGYKRDACCGNHEHLYSSLLIDEGFEFHKGDKRALKYSNLPKKGTIFVSLKGHACVVKDNVVLDRWDSRRHRVLGYWVKR